jgi:hypothetical protein
MKTMRWIILVLACAGAYACSSGPAYEAPSGSGPNAGTGGNTVTPEIANTASALAFEELKQEAEAAEGLDMSGALASYPTDFIAELSYDPSAALGLDTIQGSALALSEGELAKLGEQGFVVSKRREFPTFLRGMAEIYSEHLPLYVSADSILESVHSSYDAILLEVEYVVLIPTLERLLERTHERIAASDAPAAVKADADVYIAIARSLLLGSVQLPKVGGDVELVRKIYAGALAANGIEQVKLFGVDRMEDFSQFTPRGHYTGEPKLEQYFRAMMWLGRVDFRLIETLPDGKQVFRPDQYQAMLLMHEALAPDMQAWRTIDDAIRTFVGESDYMVVPEVESLVEDLGGLAAAKMASDEDVTAAIVAGGYGEQEICSHLMVNDGTVETLPLNRSFLVFGQRYIPDSHVFSEVVYDRLPDLRMMPSPLDAAFSALGNNHALALNQGELEKFDALPGALARMRVLIDSHDQAFWEANFYGLWMDALRALSPAKNLSAVEGLPEVAKTEAWGRRILNTQLGSWAELRHDTLLYAKQSYTSIPACEFPDAYVDPYPEFYAAIVKYAEQGSRIAEIAEADPNGYIGPKVTAYFDALRSTAAKLGEMAQAQRRGEAFSAEQLAFINDAVRVDEQSEGCVTVEHANGWYADLFYNRDKSLEFDPTIADVHTQPADESGAIVGKVLHAGTGYPRYLVTTIDTCSGPRAYAGVVYAYHEHVTEDFERLTDEQWAERFQSGERPAEVPWLSDVLGE